MLDLGFWVFGFWSCEFTYMSVFGFWVLRLGILTCGVLAVRFCVFSGLCNYDLCCAAFVLPCIWACLALFAFPNFGFCAWFRFLGLDFGWLFAISLRA